MYDSLTRTPQLLITSGPDAPRPKKERNASVKTEFDTVNGLCPDEGHYVRNDVLTDDETRSGTDRAGPFDELTFLDGQNLRADDPRGARPTHDGNCQDDRGEAGRKDDYEYQDEREPRYHKEEIGHTCEDQVCNAAVEAANDAH